jgi:hypothetical protein
MQQPESIERFEQLFFVRFVLGIVVAIYTWNDNVERFHQSPLADRMGDGVLYIVSAFSITISLLLWFFIARRGSEVAKWIYIVLFGFSLLSLLAFLAPLPEGAPRFTLITQVSTVVGLALTAASVWFLFRPDTRAWFNKGVDPKA